MNGEKPVRYNSLMKFTARWHGSLTEVTSQEQTSERPSLSTKPDGGADRRSVLFMLRLF